MGQKFLRISDVKERTGLSRTSVYRLMREKDFPQSIPLGEQMVAWIEQEVEQWIDDRIKAARAA